MIICKNGSGNAAVPAGFRSAKEEFLALCSLTAFLEDLAVDLRLVAPLDDQGEARCREDRLYRFSDRDNIGEVPLPGAGKVQADDVSTVRSIRSFCPFTDIVDQVPAVVPDDRGPVDRTVTDLECYERGRRSILIFQERESGAPAKPVRDSPCPAICSGSPEHQVPDYLGPAKINIECHGTPSHQRFHGKCRMPDTFQEYHEVFDSRCSSLVTDLLKEPGEPPFGKFCLQPAFQFLLDL